VRIARRITTSRIGIGVGTPARILELVREGMHAIGSRRQAGTRTDSVVAVGALKLDDLRAVILDMSSINAKQLGLFGIRETCSATIDLLNEPTLKARWGDKTLVLVY